MVNTEMPDIEASETGLSFGFEEMICDTYRDAWIEGLLRGLETTANELGSGDMREMLNKDFAAWLKEVKSDKFDGD